MHFGRQDDAGRTVRKAKILRSERRGSDGVGGACTLAIVVLLGTPAAAQTTADGGRPTLGFYGAPGMLDMPTAEMMDDGEISATVGTFGGLNRGAVTFQITPRLQGGFRYSGLEREGDDTFSDPSDLYFDRAFDVSYQIVTEGAGRPAVTIGLRDFGGTGIYASEYVVATKNFDSGLSATLGMGWGRYGSYNSFRNPISYIFDGFRTRPDNDSRVAEGNVGDVDFGQWFHGPAALFGGVQYRYNDQLVLTLEYSSDAYDEDSDPSDFVRDIPINFGATYQFDNGVDLTGAYMYGETFGVLLSYRFNPKSPPGPDGGRAGLGPVVVPRSAAPLGWGTDLDEARDGTAAAAPAGQAQMEAVLRRTLGAQGIVMLGARQEGSSIRIWMENTQFQAEAEALGRAARALTAVLPAGIETMVLIPVAQGMPLSEVTLHRADLEELQDDLDGSWKMFSRAAIGEAAPLPSSVATTVGARFSYGVSAYVGPTFSNPDNLLAEGGLRFNAAYVPRPGLVLSTELRQPLLRTGSGEVPLTTGSGITRVRSDAGLFEDDYDFEVRQLKAAYFARPASAFYSRLSAGYLEEMYAGVSGELLWKPVASQLALGAELNYAMKRSPDELMGLGDYETMTGYLSAYYDLGDGYMAQVDAGRYLAQDWGGSLSLQREFDNGFILGAYMTLTDVPFEDFGEGSFDKGIYFSVPFTWLWGKPSPRNYSAVWKPINGDGGARMQISDRLYDRVRSAQSRELQDSWGRFWR
ncbi:YjbH domain-containing protein [Pseudooceanicola algae]|uniref:Exopolysaccharide biosynthesis protein YbjH n=1 Tax=Pseudooceanicola algae TaxID=1537215 RepID=A0A418SD85_9RHOB|nr:YjbH domain-containing protein [Pseudooceanicola algae]QPM92568.1 hypothetical protein PSAL_038320 [Pseudooceanicola algae]